MALLLYINGQQADLEPGQQIARTLQVNDLNSLDNRQASYTNKFKLPKTSTNLKIMQFLTVAGNNSNIPYQKNECSLYSDTGECFVYKGWAVITDGGTDFEAVIYDGIIDLYKEIENKNLSELELDDELDHTKSIEAVKESWENDSLNYRYILADYNGKTGNTASGEVNIDYLVPSVRVSYIWDKIFRLHAGGGYGDGYTGSVFEMEDFFNLWMTFPKGITSSQSMEEVFVSSDYGFLPATAPTPYHPKPNSYFAQFISYESSLLYQSPQNIHHTVGTPGRYKIEISGKIYGRNLVFVPSDGYDPFGNDGWIEDDTASTYATSRIFIARNSHGLTPLQAQPDVMLFDDIGNTYFETTEYLDLEGLESFCIVIAPKYPAENKTFYITNNTSDLRVKITKINQSEVGFNEALKDFSIRDFLTEVVQRFGLTMFKDKYSNRYHFLTLQEHLQTNAIVDWSDKFISKTKENYIVGSYAQHNWFRYNYNDKEASHYDSYIEIANVNLPDSKDIIKSKIYAPEKPLNRSTYLNSVSNVYKLWDKEPVEDPQPGEDIFTYKALDKRFYFLRCVPKTSQIKLVSDELGEGHDDEPVAQFHYREVYNKLNFSDIVRNYYRPLSRILDKAVMVSADMWLSEPDMAAFDFRKLYYIEQLSSYFIVNKISNYLPGKPVKCELIKVDYGTRQEVLPNAQINSVTLQDGKAVVDFDINVLLPYSLMMKSGGSFYTSVGSNVQNPFVTTTTLTPGTYYFMIMCGSQLSNVVSITVE